MLGTNIHTYDGFSNAVKKRAAVIKKNYTKAENITSDNKRYMQTKAFWSDPHNKKMMHISDMLMMYRDKLTARAASFSDTYIQNLDGSLTKKPRKQPYEWVTVENNFYSVYKDTLAHYSQKMRPFIEKQKELLKTIKTP